MNRRALPRSQPPLHPLHTVTGVSTYGCRRGYASSPRGRTTLTLTLSLTLTLTLARRGYAFLSAREDGAARHAALAAAAGGTLHTDGGHGLRYGPNPNPTPTLTLTLTLPVPVPPPLPLPPPLTRYDPSLPFDAPAAGGGVHVFQGEAATRSFLSDLRPFVGGEVRSLRPGPTPTPTLGLGLGLALALALALPLTRCAPCSSRSGAAGCTLTLPLTPPQP